MGSFCIVFGVIVFLAFLAMGHIAGVAFVMDNLFNILGGNAEFVLKDFLAIPTGDKLFTYLICLGIFAFFGIMIGLGVFMSGLIYNRLNNIERVARRAARRS